MQYPVRNLEAWTSMDTNYQYTVTGKQTTDRPYVTILMGTME